MAGGLFEGLVRLYTEKDWWCKHLFFVAFAIITCLNELLKVPKNNASVEASFEFLGGQLLLFLLVIIVMVVSGLFSLHFNHNCIKYFRKLATVENKKALKKLPLMPYFDGHLFNHFGDWACFSIAWFLFILGFGIITFLICLIPIVGLIAVPCVVILLTVAMPFVSARFAEDYKTEGNLNPSLVFSIFPKIWKPTLWLWVRFLLLYLAIGLIGLLPYWVIVSVSDVATFVLSVIYAYIGLVMSYAYYYSTMYIYCENDV